MWQDLTDNRSGDLIDYALQNLYQLVHIILLTLRALLVGCVSSRTDQSSHVIVPALWSDLEPGAKP